MNKRYFKAVTFSSLNHYGNLLLNNFCTEEAMRSQKRRNEILLGGRKTFFFLKKKKETWTKYIPANGTVDGTGL